MALNSLYYFKNGEQTFSIGENYDEHLVEDSLNVVRPLDAHDQVQFDLYFSKDDLAVTGKENQKPIHSDNNDIAHSTDRAATNGVVFEDGGVKHYVYFSNNSGNAYIKVGDGDWTTQTGSIAATVIQGVTSDPEDRTIWIVGSHNNTTVYSYQYNPKTQTLSRQTANEFTQNVSASIRAISYHDNKLEIYNRDEDVYSWTVAGVGTGNRAATRNTSGDWEVVATGINQVVGATVIGDIKYVIGSVLSTHGGGRKGYAFNKSDNSRASYYDFVFTDGNDDPQGAYTDGNYVGAVDRTKKKTYYYKALYGVSKLPVGEKMDGFHIIQREPAEMKDNKQPTYESSEDVSNPTGMEKGFVVDVSGTKHSVMAKEGSRSIWVKVGTGNFTEKSNVLAVAPVDFDVSGMTIDHSDNTVWVAFFNSSTNTLEVDGYTYNTTTQTLDRKSSADIAQLTFFPTSILYADNKLEITQSGSTSVRVWDVATTTDRTVTRASSKDWTLDSVNTGTLASTAIGTIKYFIRGGSNARAYAYNTSDNSRAADFDFNLNSSNTTAKGAYTDGDYIGVIDSSDNKSYYYSALMSSAGMMVPDAQRKDIVYTLYVDNIDLAYDRDGGAIASITAVSFPFYLNFVTTDLDTVENKYLMKVIRDKIPQTGTNNYTNQLAKYRPLFDVDKGYYIVSANLFSQSAYDILNDFANSGIIKYFRTDWKTTDTEKGEALIDIVFQGDTNPAKLTDIIGYDYQTLRSRKEVADKVDTVYVVTPERQGSEQSIVHNMLSYQVLYDIGYESWAKPSVTTVPISNILGTPSRDTSRDISANGEYAALTTGEQSQQIVYAVKNTNATTMDTTLYWTDNVQRFSATHSRSAQFTAVSGYTFRGLTYDQDNKILYALIGGTDARVQIYQKADDSETLTYVSYITLPLGGGQSGGTSGGGYSDIFFANNRLYTVWSSAYYFGGTRVDPERISAYAFTNNTLIRSPIDDWDRTDPSVYGIQASTRLYFDKYVCLVQDASGNPAGVTAYKRLLFFTEKGKRLPQYDVSFDSTISVKDVFYQANDIMLYNTGTPVRMYAYDTQIVNMDTTSRIYTVGVQANGDELKDFDCLWLSDRRTIAVNSKYLKTDNTRTIGITGYRAERRPLRVKVGDAVRDISVTINGNTNSTTEAKELGLRYLAALTSARKTLTFQYNTRYQSATHTFYDPLPGDIVDVDGTNYTIITIEDIISRNNILRNLTLQESYHYNLQRDIRNYETILEDRISDVFGSVDA